MRKCVSTGLWDTVSLKQSGSRGGDLSNPLCSNLKRDIKLWEMLEYIHQAQAHKGWASWTPIPVPTVTQQGSHESSCRVIPVYNMV